MRNKNKYNGKKLEFIKRITAKLLTTSITLFKHSLKLYNYIKRILLLFNHILISFITICLCSIILFSKFKIAFQDEKDFIPIIIAIGSTLITILILTYSISIIPIQRAIESFSKTISNLYRTDKITKIIFLLISIFSVGSLLSISLYKIFTIDLTFILILNIILTGVTLDLLHWYYNRICKLLEPNYAIQIFTKNVNSKIKKYQSKVSLISKLNFHLLTKSDQQGKKPSDFETAFYLTSNNIQSFINYRISELTEIAIKSLAKNEIDTVSIAVDGIAQIAIQYITSRRNNIIYHPSKAANYFVSESDIDKVLNKIYNDLFIIAQKSHLDSNQHSSIQCLEILARISNSIIEILFDPKIPHSKDLLFIPFSYAGNIIEEAQIKNLDEVVLQGCKIFEEVINKMYQKRSIVEVDSLMCDLYTKLILKYILDDKKAYGNQVLEFMLKRLSILIIYDPYNLSYALRETIKNLEIIFPYALTASNQGKPNLLYFHLSVPYDYVNENAFAHFIEKTCTLNKYEEKKPHVNPYYDFIQFNDYISQHFRSIAENNDLGNSVYFWHIIYSIKAIIKVYFSLLENPLTEISNHIDKLVEQISWYLSFLWVAFSKSSKISKNYTNDSFELNCWTALFCYKSSYYKKLSPEFRNIIDHCFSNFLSMLNDYSKRGESKSSYDYSDLIIYIWCLRLVVIHKNETYRLKKFDPKLHECNFVGTELKEDFLKALEIRYKQFIDDLFDNGIHCRIMDADKSISLLKDLKIEKSFYENNSPFTFYNS